MEIKVHKIQVGVWFVAGSAILFGCGSGSKSAPKPDGGGDAGVDVGKDTKPADVGGGGDTTLTALRLVVTPTTGVVAVGEGAQATFMVALNRAPDATLTVSVTSSNATIAAVMPAALTFNAANFAAAQVVTVQGVQDANTVDNTANVVLAATGVTSVTVRVDVTDDDVQTIQATPTGLSITEGTTGHFDVRLAAQPLADVTITVLSALPAKTTVAPATLTFTAANYATVQAVTVTALQDPDVVDDLVNVTLTSTGLPTVTVPVTDVDDDSQGLAVTPAAVTVTEGSTAPGTFEVHLNQMPSTSVTVNLASANTLAATVSPATLTFTPANYLTNQTGSVLPVSDDNTLGETTAINVTSAGLTARAVAVTVVDDDVQAIVVLPTTGVTVLEGATTSFSVRLAFNPASTVSVSISTSNATKMTTTSTSLTFDATNFASPQTVTVRGEQDDDLVAEAETLTLALAGSTNVTVPVTVTDDDTQTLIVSSTTVAVLEGSTSSFTVRLGFRPTAAVTVTTAALPTLVATAAPLSLTFAPATFATPQLVTVMGAEDADVVDNTATVTVASAGVTPVTVNVNVTDNDRQAILASPNNLAFVESGSQGTMVRLNFAPIANTTVTLVSSSTKVSVSPATLTFSPSDYLTGQAVTVSSPADPDASDEIATLTLSAAGISDSVVDVKVTDVDTQTLVVSPVTVTVTEQGAPGTFNVHLSAQPLLDATVNIVSGTPGLVSALPAMLTFTTGNYGTDQMVTVLGLPDPNLVGELVNVTVSSTVASTVSVAVTDLDDDQQSLVVTPEIDVLPNIGSLGVIEDTTPADLGIALAFQPTAGQTVRVQSNNPGSVLVNDADFVDIAFTATNYGTPQLIRVTTPSDNNLDKPASTTITVGLCGASCSDPFIGFKTVTVDPRDDDIQHIVTSVSAIGILEDPSLSGVFTVHLAFEPLAAGSEEVSVTSSDTGAAIVASGTPLTFDASNYRVPQPVAVSGVNDLDVNNESVTMTLHSTFATTADATVTVNVTDKDTQALILSSAAGALQEPPTLPSTSTFTVRPQFDPAGSLTVTLTSPDTGAVTVSPPTLTFTTANYLVAQTVTVTAVSDEDVRNEVVAITAGAPGGVQTVTYTANVTDDDTQGLVTVASASVVEESTALVPVHLAFQPTVGVTVMATITAPDGKVSVSGPITFSAANYLTDQSFTLTGFADADLDDVSGTLTLVSLIAGPTLPDQEYPPTLVLPISVFDNDEQAMLVSWTPPAPFVNSVQELGPDGAFQVHLAFPPRGIGDDVVQVSLPPGLTGHAAIIGPTTLVFTDASFATDQTIPFRAISDADTADDFGNIALLIDESDDPHALSRPVHANVSAGAPVRLIDRANGVIDTTNYPDLFGGTQVTERANIQWGTTSYLVSGRNVGGVFSVGLDNLELSALIDGPTIGTAASDGFTQSIKWNGTNFGVFATDGTSIRYTQVSPLATVGASSTFGLGAAEFWVTNNPSAARYAVLYRASSTNNLLFSQVPYGGTASAPQIVTSADASPDQAPNLHYVGGTTGAAYAYNAVTTPYVALYTASSGVVCLRLTATGAVVSGGGSTTLNPTPDFFGSVWIGNQLAAVHHGAAGGGGLDIELITLPSTGTACSEITVNALLDNTYVNTPSVAFNGVELAVGYDVSLITDPIVGTAVTFVGVYLYNPTTHLASNRVFNGTTDVPGERPSITWAGDRWLLRYSSAAGVQVRSGSLVP
jgi:hypothetical protein